MPTFLISIVRQKNKEMKKISTLVLIILICINCSAQKHSEKKYESSYKNENSELVMKLLNKKHLIEFSRKFDSIDIKMEIYPSLTNIFDSVYDLDKNKLVILSLSEKENGKYIVKQIDFKQNDGRNISIHEGSDDVYSLDLLKYKVNMIKCTNCTDYISFAIYIDDSNDG